MASTKTDGEAAKPGGKKWDGNAERDLCLALLLGGSADGEKIRLDWTATHQVMQKLGYEFTKDAMCQRWSKTITKDFRARTGVNDTPSATETPKKTPTKRKKATTAATMPAEATEENGDETASVTATPPATPTAKPRKRTPAKGKAAAAPRKTRGGKAAKSAEKVAVDDDDKDTALGVAEAVKKEAEDEIKVEVSEDDEDDQCTPSKKSKIVAEEEDTEMGEI